MYQDPNYNEVSVDVDMFVENPLPEPLSLIQKIFLVIKEILCRIIWKRKEIEKEHYPLPFDLIFAHIRNLNDEKNEESHKKIGIYIIRNKITNDIIVTKDNINTIKSQYNSNNYEIIEQEHK